MSILGPFMLGSPAPLPVMFPRPEKRPITPAQDSFHVPPPAYKQFAPGTALHVRPVHIDLLGILKQKVQAWQLLYRTTDPHGAAEVTATTVLVPASHNFERPQLLGYQCAIDSSSRECFPSYCLLAGVRAPLANSQFELPMIFTALRLGWIVSVSDHGGQSGRYGVGRQSGYHILDGLRATLSFQQLQLSVDAGIGLWGYSGGGMATGWAAEMAPSYAPELNIVGAALGSPAPDPAGGLLAINGSIAVGLAIAMISALRDNYPGLDFALERHLSVRGKTMLNAVADMSPARACLRYMFTDLEDYLDIPLAEFTNLPDIREMNEDMRLGRHVPKCPLLVYSAVHDQLVDIESVDRMTDFYTAHGTPVTYYRDRLSEHLSLAILGAPAALHWLSRQFSNSSAEAPRDRRTVRSMLALGGVPRSLWIMIGAVHRLLTGGGL